MRGRRTFQLAAPIAVAAGVWLGGVAASTAQAPDCQALTSAGGATGYGPRPGSDRCEGLYRPRVAGGGDGIDLVSLTFGAVRYPMDSAGVLEFAGPSASLPSFSVTGTGVPPALYYHLAGEVDSGATSLAVPLGAVLVPSRLDADKIGFYGWRQLPGARTAYVPLRVSLRGAAPSQGTEIVALLRPRTDVQAVRWRVRDTAAASAAYVALGPGIISKGRRIEVRFNPPSGSSRVVLDVAYQTLTQGDHDPLQFDILLR